MARRKDEVHNRRVSFAIAEKDYQMYKAFANVCQQDVGSIFRTAVELYLEHNKEKFERSMRAMKQLQDLKADICQ